MNNAKFSATPVPKPVNGSGIRGIMLGRSPSSISREISNEKAYARTGRKD